MTKTERRAVSPRRVKQAPRKGLIQLSLDEAGSVQRPSRFVVRLPDGRGVEVPNDFDADALERLLAVLLRC